MTANQQQLPSLKNIKNFIDNYAKAIDDIQAVRDFKICESDEGISSLRAELTAVANKVVPTEILDNIVGKKRSVKHGSYEAWAKMMFLWLAIKNE